MKVNWEAEREYDEYTRVTFKIYMLIQGYKKIQVVRGGKPKTLISGRIHIRFDQGLDRDYSPVKVFNEKSRVGKLMKKIHERVTEREVDEYWEVLNLTLQHDLVGEVKRFFGMQDSGN